MFALSLHSPGHPWLAGACRLLACGLPFLVVWHFAVTPAGDLLAHAGMAHLQPALVAPGGAWLAWLLAALSLVPVSCMAFALWQAGECFVRFGRAEYFTLGVVRNLRRIAVGLVAAGIASALVPPMASLLLSTALPQGQRSLVVSVGSQELVLLVISALLWQITSVMERAVALAEENQQFV